MEERVIRAVPWAIVSYGGNLALRLATTVVLARILVPTEFGLFALAALVTTGLLTLLAGLGLDATLVVRRDLTDREASFVAAEYLHERLEEEDLRRLYDVPESEVLRLIELIGIK